MICDICILGSNAHSRKEMQINLALARCMHLYLWLGGWKWVHVVKINHYHWPPHIIPSPPSSYVFSQCLLTRVRPTFSYACPPSPHPVLLGELENETQRKIDARFQNIESNILIHILIFIQFWNILMLNTESCWNQGTPPLFSLQHLRTWASASPLHSRLFIMEVF